MTPLKGHPLAKEIRNHLSVEILRLAEIGIRLKLSVVLVGNDAGSVWYADAKAKLGERLQITVDIHKLPSAAKTEDVISLIEKLNADKYVHGILVELPLPEHLDKTAVLGAILPLKDVDGVTPLNRGYILNGQEDLALTAATPQACINLIEQSGRPISGSKITLVGRGDTVGRPLAMMLVKRDATVTICHTKTQGLSEECKKADILIAAAGKAGLITEEMIKPGSVVIDAGVNLDKQGNYVGDVVIDKTKEVAGFLTPVPGGVGSLTTTIIMKNTLKAFNMQSNFK